jgi:hypothetical protein
MSLKKRLQINNDQALKKEVYYVIQM